MNGHGSGNAHQPPPSSMLATHFAPANGNSNGKALPDFDKYSFDLLLEESLGHNDDGEPNLGSDIDTNHLLIYVLFQAGIDRASGRMDNPFNAHQTGRDDLQVISCLDVIKLAVERSPDVLFVLAPPAGRQSGQDVPLFVWLIPRLLALLTNGEAVEINEKVREVLETLLAAESLCSKAGLECSTVSEFFQACTDAILEDFDDDISSVLQQSVTLGGDQKSFTGALSKLRITETRPDDSLPSTTISAAFVAALTTTSCRSVSLARSPGSPRTVRFRVTSQLLGQLESIWQHLIDGLEDDETASSGLAVDFFSTLQRLKLVALDENLSTCRQRCTLLWASCFSDCMELAHTLIDTPCREAVKTILESTLQAAIQDAVFCHALFEILDSKLHVIAEERQLDSELHVSHLAALLPITNAKCRN